MAPAAERKRTRRIVGGVDTHLETHHAAVQLMNGARIADAQFPATSRGYALLLAWLRSFGRLHAVGVEGTGAYGAGLTRYLHDHGVQVIEVNRPDRGQRRAKGKSDPLDAYAAADAVLAGRARTVPKSADGIVESIRAIHTIRAGAVKARTAAMNELRSLLVTAPAALREQLTAKTARQLIHTCAHLRPSDTRDPGQGVKFALRAVARRHQQLTEEITAADEELHLLVNQARPDLTALRGVGDETAAQLLITAGDNPDRLTGQAAFAALCGVSPIPASSGKTRRHRLNRGGDRQANRALHTIALSRMSHCPRTRAYVARRTAQGLDTKEIMRCLKRYIAREIFKILTRANTLSEEGLHAA
ncbi:IS110 family transposase [Actinocorallia sp. B10E7]|uniref:IS110 family transposase n=1 Tax=Actinocorallia sp. B10E7 TaxID=3153558 RepID=UPI00325C9896